MQIILYFFFIKNKIGEKNFFLKKCLDLLIINIYFLPIFFKKSKLFCENKNKNKKKIKKYIYIYILIFYFFFTI